MSSLFRRAGAQIAKILASTVDPAAVAGQVQLYAKDVAGIVQLFARTSDGAVSRLSNNAQVFRYVATGAEANPFTVNLPAARANANYNVQAAFGGPAANAIKSLTPLASSFGVSSFSLQLGTGAENGDVYMFTVEDHV